MKKQRRKDNLDIRYFKMTSRTEERVRQIVKNAKRSTLTFRVTIGMRKRGKLIEDYKLLQYFVRRYDKLIDTNKRARAIRDFLWIPFEFYNFIEEEIQKMRSNRSYYGMLGKLKRERGKAHRKAKRFGNRLTRRRALFNKIHRFFKKFSWFRSLVHKFNETLNKNNYFTYRWLTFRHIHEEFIQNIHVLLIFFVLEYDEYRVTAVWKQNFSRFRHIYRGPLPHALERIKKELIDAERRHLVKVWKKWSHLLGKAWFMEVFFLFFYLHYMLFINAWVVGLLFGEPDFYLLIGNMLGRSLCIFFVCHAFFGLKNICKDYIHNEWMLKRVNTALLIIFVDLLLFLGPEFIPTFLGTVLYLTCYYSWLYTIKFWILVYKTWKIIAGIFAFYGKIKFIYSQMYFLPQFFLSVAGQSFFIFYLFKPIIWLWLWPCSVYIFFVQIRVPLAAYVFVRLVATGRRFFKAFSYF